MSMSFPIPGRQPEVFKLEVEHNGRAIVVQQVRDHDGDTFFAASGRRQKDELLALCGQIAALVLANDKFAHSSPAFRISASVAQRASPWSGRSLFRLWASRTRGAR